MKYRFIALFTLLVIAAVSCNKNLDQTLYDTQTLEGNVKTTADVVKMIQGLYGNFQSTDLYKKELLKLLTLCGDDFNSSTTEFQVYSNKSYDPTSPSISASYSAYYNIINNCNYLLEKLPSINTISGSDSVLKVRAEGNILFFRAFCYFDLVRLFGGVPLRTASTSVNTNFYISRSPVDSVYAQIFADLNRADSLLAFKSSPDGIVLTNKGAAFALQSLAYLTYGNYLDRNGGLALDAYKNASRCADSVILKGGYSLNLVTNYADLWNVKNESDMYGSEVIFGIRFTRDRIVASSNSQGSDLPARFLPTTMGGVTGNPTANGSGLIAAGSGTYRVMPWFYDYYRSGDTDYISNQTGAKTDYQFRDYRVDTTFLTSWRRTPTSGTFFNSYPNKTTSSQDSLPSPFPFISKYIDGKGIDGTNHENDMYLLRLSEIYLIRAEAQNEINNGPTAAAIADFNKLRARARNGNITLPRKKPYDLKNGVLTQNEFRTKIFIERGLEFIGEGKRWFDLVRMKDPTGSKTMYEYQYSTFLPTLPKGSPVYDRTTKTWSGGKTDDFSVVPFNSKYLLFPIPQQEIDLNNKLSQNPGW